MYYTGREGTNNSILNRQKPPTTLYYTDGEATKSIILEREATNNMVLEKKEKPPTALY